LIPRNKKKIIKHLVSADGLFAKGKSKKKYLNIASKPTGYVHIWGSICLHRTSRHGFVGLQHNNYMFACMCIRLRQKKLTVMLTILLELIT